MALRTEYLGPSPCDEECAQVGTDEYPERSRAECKALIMQLKLQFGEPPDGSRFKVVSEDHDFGSYREVAYVFDTENDAHISYFLDIEDQYPRKWIPEALAMVEEVMRGYGVRG